MRPERPQLVKQEADEAQVQELHPREVTRQDRPMALFKEAELADFHAQWVKVQTGFVDEPRRTVQDADQLVASVMQRLAQGFADERGGLEKQWSQGGNVSTEDLRLALQRYRSFFDRLLSL